VAPDTNMPSRLRLVVAAIVALGGAALVAWAAQADLHWFELHETPHFCAENPALKTRAVVLRLGGAVAGLALLLFAGRAGRWAGRRPASEVVAAVARSALAIVLALGACDLLLRRFGPPPRVITGPNYHPATIEHPRYGYSVRPSSSVEYRIGAKSLRYIYDANGYRVGSPEASTDFARPSILFTGESVAAGFCINDEETYARMVGDELGVQAVNLAVPGYGDDTAYMRLSDELPRFQHPLAVVTSALHSTIERNTWPDRPHLVFEDEGTTRWIPAVTRIGDPMPRLSPLVDVFHTFYRSAEPLHQARAAFVATAREARARGAFPLFVLTNTNIAEPCLPDETGAPSIERTLFEGLGVAHIRVDLGGGDLDPVLRHPTLRGQRKIAEAVERALLEKGIGASRAAQ
jgi:hypothetical protein